MALAYTLASFCAFLPTWVRVVIVGAFAALMLFLLVKLVGAIMDAIPFL